MYLQIGRDIFASADSQLLNDNIGHKTGNDLELLGIEEEIHTVARILLASLYDTCTKVDMISWIS